MMHVVDPAIISETIASLDQRIRDLRTELVRLQNARNAFAVLQPAEPSSSEGSPEASAPPKKKRGRPRKPGRPVPRPALRNSHPSGKITRRTTLRVCQVLADIGPVSVDELAQAVAAKDGYKRVSRKFRRKVAVLVYRRSDLFAKGSSPHSWELTSAGKALVQAALAATV